MDKDITICGLRLHYTDNGDSDRVLVLMHGWGCDHTTLVSIENVALKAGYRVVNVDFPGFGQSQEPDQVWGIEEYTSLMESLINELVLKSPVLLGHSFGGRVGILYASRNADVKGLILVDSAGIKPRRSLKYYFKVYSFKISKFFTYLFCSREKADKIIDAQRAKRGSSDYASASPMMRRIMSKVVNEDLSDRLSQIKSPTLLLWGENDTATPMADAKKMERCIPGAGLVSFPGCGHYSFLDNPVQFSAVLKSFLNSLSES